MSTPSHPIRGRARRVVIPLIALLLLGCGGSPNDPAVGALVVRAAATGPNADIAFLLSVDGGADQLLLAGDSVRMEVTAGTHEVALAGVAPNCALSGAAVRAEEVAARSRTEVRYDLSCAASPARIAYVRQHPTTEYPGLIGDLYVMSDDGLLIDQLTEGMDPAQAAWDPLGDRLAFAAGNAGEYDIFVVNVDGTNLTQLTSDPLSDGWPQWSPDGTQILFERRRGTSSISDLWVMNADGSHARPLTTYSQAGRPSWSPDGNWIVFSGAPPGNADNQLWVMSRSGGTLRRLTPGQTGAGSPRWSPDGRKILFLSPANPSVEIFVMNADGSSPVNLTRGRLRISREASWSPDGSRIVFEGLSHEHVRRIYVMDADGTGLGAITDGEWSERSPAWRPF